MTLLLPPELFVKIVEFLPDEVIFNLWCTGRELHGIKSIYIEKILPHVRFQTFIKLENMQKDFYVQIDDGGILKNYGIVGCTVKKRGMSVMLNIGFAYIYIWFDKHILVTVIWVKDDFNRKSGYILQKAEFTTCYLFFTLLKLKIK